MTDTRRQLGTLSKTVAQNRLGCGDPCPSTRGLYSSLISARATNINAADGASSRLRHHRLEGFFDLFRRVEPRRDLAGGVYDVQCRRAIRAIELRHRAAELLSVAHLR